MPASGFSHNRTHVPVTCSLSGLSRLTSISNILLVPRASRIVTYIASTWLLSVLVDFLLGVTNKMTCSALSSCGVNYKRLACTPLYLIVISVFSVGRPTLVARRFYLSHPRFAASSSQMSQLGQAYVPQSPSRSRQRSRARGCDVQSKRRRSHSSHPPRENIGRQLLSLCRSESPVVPAAAMLGVPRRVRLD